MQRDLLSCSSVVHVMFCRIHARLYMHVIMRIGTMSAGLIPADIVNMCMYIKKGCVIMRIGTRQQVTKPADKHGYIITCDLFFCLSTFDEWHDGTCVLCHQVLSSRRSHHLHLSESMFVVCSKQLTSLSRQASKPADLNSGAILSHLHEFGSLASTCIRQETL